MKNDQRRCRTVSASQPEYPPVLILGGFENSLSIVRSLSSKNIPVRVSALEHCPALKSRFCKGRFVIPCIESVESFWSDLLLGGSRSDLRGNVIFACDDFAVEFLAKHRAKLEQYYILDDSIPALQLNMLDKQKTLELARSAGCAVPQFWKVDTLEDLEPIHCNVNFPIMIKPIHSHTFQSALGKKFFVVHSHQELDERVKQVLDRWHKIMVCEIIPGRDSEVQSSYYTYIDRQGVQLFRFTKRVIRRTPTFGGKSVLHMTQWLPETAEAGERFFRGIGFRGLGQIEFKRDFRDGQLKVIECNPRFTTAQELLLRCGIDAAYLIYCRLTGRPVPPTNSYEENLYLWYPVADFMHQLRGLNGLSVSDWFHSVLHWNTIFPCFKPEDPWPSFALTLYALRDRLQVRRASRTEQGKGRV
jgi:D-aspartate ligase